MQYIVFTIIGLVLIVLAKPMAKLMISAQNATWGFKFGERDALGARIAVVVVGVGMLVAAIVGLLRSS